MLPNYRDSDQEGSHSNMRLSDMLKRKRVSTRKGGSSRKGRHSDGGATFAAAAAAAAASANAAPTDPR